MINGQKNSIAKKLKEVFKHYEEFEEKTYSECSDDIKIMSILNLDSDHMWPEAGYNKDTGISSYTNFGSCVGDIQSIFKCSKML